MPEVVECEIQVDGLKKLEGLEITKVEFRDGGEVVTRPHDKETFDEILVGRIISKINRIGKYIVFHLNGVYMTSHLAMTGRWFIGKEETPHTRVLIHLKGEFWNNYTLQYIDVRKFGRIRLEDDLNDKKYDKKYGDVLFKRAEELERIIKLNKHKVDKWNVKELLTNQKLLVGIGNVYANEILSHACIHPAKPVKNLTENQRFHLTKAIEIVLYNGYKYGGLSLKDYFHVDGSKGEMQKHLNVYQKKECTFCKGEIETTTVLDKRKTFYCPNCQK
ncbi:formamidopyrimidine DNA glycosylase [Bacillus phage YungSlug]|nr:formamidopyrimidine DNA glycosylase [Bacillus phage YungSlug]